MLERLLIAGSGGQGVVLIGKLLASAAVDLVEHVTFFPSYGAEVRGGASNCQIVLSSDEIASPVPEAFDSMILMTRNAVDLFLSRREEDCLIVLNRSLCDTVGGDRVIAIDALGIADRLGDTRTANFAMLGAYLAHKPGVPAVAVTDALGRMLASKGKAFVGLNLRALQAGLEAGGK